MEPVRAILICAGNDRPGLLDDIGLFLLERAGNIQDSRLLNLHGSFAMLSLISASPAGMDRIKADLPTLAAAAKIHCEIQPAHSKRQANSFVYHFKANGRDQAGVLQRIGHLLRALNINIDDVTTTLADSEDSRPPFELQLMLSVPREIPVSMLRDYIKHLCGEMEITWELEQA